MNALFDSPQFVKELAEKYAALDNPAGNSTRQELGERMYRLLAYAILKGPNGILLVVAENRPQRIKTALDRTENFAKEVISEYFKAARKALEVDEAERVKSDEDQQGSTGRESSES